MTAISRGSVRSSGGRGAAGKGGNVPALLRPQAGLSLRAHAAHVDQTALEEAHHQTARERPRSDTGLPRRQEGE